MINFPIVDISPVNPIDRPTVPKAEMTSNSNFKKGSGSVIFKVTMAKKIKLALMVKIAKERKTTFSLMALLPTVIFCFSLIKVITESMITILFSEMFALFFPFLAPLQ